MKAMIFGCGYLGKRVATAWIAQGHEVSAFTRSVQNAELLSSAGIRPHVGDVCDPRTLKGLPAADIVLYAIGFDRSSGRAQEEVTCGGTQNVLSQLQGHCERFVLISSTSVYGQTAGEWVDESCECQPTQLGGQLNLAAEHLVHEHFSLHDDTTIQVLRLAGIYGPGRLLSRMESIRAGSPISGCGDAWLNLIHVDDAASAVVACASFGARDATYNVVDDRPIQRREYFELLARIVGAPPPTFDPTRAVARGSGGLNKRCSNRRIRQAFGWSPVYPSIDTGLPAAVEASH